MAGAIWGQIQLGDKLLEQNVATRMEQSMKIYPLDRIEQVIEKQVYFACGHQHVTRGAEKEQVPFYDEKHATFFAADCILDNRKEVAELLNTSGDLTDAALAYQAYLMWGESFVRHLVGIFAFAIYDQRKKELLVYTDHTGSRCIHYCKRGSSVVFSTTIGPILQAYGASNFTFCEKWLVGCEAFRAPDMILFPGLTAFEGIYQVEAGHYIKVSMDRVKKVCYWNPIKEVKKLRLAQEEEYKQLFLKTFRTCVREMLTSGGKTAMTLSSGLDSSAVACVAAPILKEQGEKLYTYTSVPLSDFERTEGFDLVDESEGPKKIAAVYDNVCPQFVSCEGKTAFSEIERFVSYTEVPGKSNANLVWLDEIYRLAREQGCRVVLKGQFGNSTISYGAILSLAYQRLLRGNVMGAKEAIREFRTRRRVTREIVIRVARSEWRGKRRPDLSMIEESFVQDKLKKKYELKKVIKRMLRCNGGSAMDSEKEHKQFMYDLCILQHLGLYDTKLGLMHGIVLRDPTKDKRIIELCMALPMECFVNHGIERRMVREYMEGIIPKEIREDVNRRGLQSADFVFRLNKQWNLYKEEIFKLLENESLYAVLDKEKLQQLVKEIKKQEQLPDTKTAQDVTVLQSLSLFFKQYEAVELNGK